jgi:hypothetical protein
LLVLVLEGEIKIEAEAPPSFLSRRQRKHH